MLKKSTKPSVNTFNCIDMMLKGAKKRRMMALSAVKALDSGRGNGSNVVMLR